MYKVFKSLVVVVWILDIMNINVIGIPLLECLEPILNDANNLNTLFWFLIFAFLPSADVVAKLNKEDK